MITTESVLLDEKRNGGKKTKDEIELILLSHLGAEKVVWLPRGLYGDDEKNTNGPQAFGQKLAETSTT